MRFFAPGTAVTWRSVDRERRHVHYAWPWTVIRHDASGVALHLPESAVAKVRTGRYGGPRDRILLDWDGGYSERVWRDTSVVMLHRFGDAHSLWFTREAATFKVAWWYVNLEEPWRQSAIGFDSRDRILDLWAGPDREWRWKDEDEVEWLVRQGEWTPEHASAVRADGERALATVRLQMADVEREFGTWRPDPSWTIPALSPSWREFQLGEDEAAARVE